MSYNRPKSINALMQHMRDNKEIYIWGSGQKRKLRNMGYFHGYKGYRFCGSPQNFLPYNNFTEIQAVYLFDMELKTCLYSRIMSVETMVKNYALEVLNRQSESNRFADIYANVLNDYKAYTVNSKQYRLAMGKRLSIRNRIYGDIALNYGRSFIVSHYYDKDAPIPIWAIFELLTFGEFGNLLHCMNLIARLDLSATLGFSMEDDSDGRLTEQIVFLLKDLRNYVAHNGAVFDARFRHHNVSNRVKGYISKSTGVENVTFDTIVDYIVLIAFVMKRCKNSKTEIRQFVREFSNLCEKLRKEIPFRIYSKIFRTDTKKKLKELNDFI